MRPLHRGSAHAIAASPGPPIRMRRRSPAPTIPPLLDVSKPSRSLLAGTCLLLATPSYDIQGIDSRKDAKAQRESIEYVSPGAFASLRETFRVSKIRNRE